MPFISAQGPQEGQVLPPDPAQIIFLQSFPTLASAVAGKEGFDPSNPPGTEIVVLGNKFRDGHILLCPIDSWGPDDFKARSFDLFRVPAGVGLESFKKTIELIVNGFGQGGEPVSVGK